MKHVIQAGCGAARAASSAHPATTSQELQRAKSQQDVRKTRPERPAKPGMCQLHAGPLSATHQLLQRQPVACRVQTSCKQRCRSCATPSPGLAGSPTRWERELLLAAGARTSPDGRRIRTPLRKAGGCVEDARREQTCSGPARPVPMGWIKSQISPGCTALRTRRASGKETCPLCSWSLCPAAPFPLLGHGEVQNRLFFVRALVIINNNSAPSCSSFLSALAGCHWGPVI